MHSAVVTAPVLLCCFWCCWPCSPAVPKNAFWEAGLKQGMDGFNAVTKGFLSSCPDWKSPSSGNVDLLPQQRVVATLVHSQSPVARLLADHNTGSGKTLVIIRVLDDFYFDKRAKIAFSEGCCG